MRDQYLEGIIELDKNISMMWSHHDGCTEDVWTCFRRRQISKVQCVSFLCGLHWRNLQVDSRSDTDQVPAQKRTKSHAHGLWLRAGMWKSFQVSNFKSTETHAHFFLLSSVHLCLFFPLPSSLFFSPPPLTWLPLFSMLCEYECPRLTFEIIITSSQSSMN